jgi:hypothetical protein
MTEKIENDVERWLVEKLGVKFVDVWFFRDGEFKLEPQVNDPTVFETVVYQRMGALRASYALHGYHGRWCLLTREQRRAIRYYDTREAAEMVAIHGA